MLDLTQVSDEHLLRIDDRLRLVGELTHREPEARRHVAAEMRRRVVAAALAEVSALVELDDAIGAILDDGM